MSRKNVMKNLVKVIEKKNKLVIEFCPIIFKSILLNNNDTFTCLTKLLYNKNLLKVKIEMPQSW